MRKRDKAVTIRLSRSEYEVLMTKLAETGLSQQTYIISAICGARPVTPEAVKVLQKIAMVYADLLLQLRGMATNINQMARIANTTGDLPFIRKLETLAFETERFRRESEQQWRSIRLLMTGRITTEP